MLGLFSHMWGLCAGQLWHFTSRIFYVKVHFTLLAHILNIYECIKIYVFVFDSFSLIWAVTLWIFQAEIQKLWSILKYFNKKIICFKDGCYCNLNTIQIFLCLWFLFVFLCKWHGSVYTVWRLIPTCRKCSTNVLCFCKTRQTWPR